MTEHSLARAYRDIEVMVSDMKIAIWVARYLHDEAHAEVERKDGRHLMSASADLSEASTWALYQAHRICDDLHERYFEGFER